MVIPKDYFGSRICINEIHVEQVFEEVVNNTDFKGIFQEYLWVPEYRMFLRLIK